MTLYFKTICRCTGVWGSKGNYKRNLKERGCPPGANDIFWWPLKIYFHCKACSGETIVLRLLKLAGTLLPRPDDSRIYLQVHTGSPQGYCFISTIWWDLWKPGTLEFPFECEIHEKLIKENAEILYLNWADIR